MIQVNWRNIYRGVYQSLPTLMNYNYKLHLRNFGNGIPSFVHDWILKMEIEDVDFCNYLFYGNVIFFTMKPMTFIRLLGGYELESSSKQKPNIL